MAATLIYSHPRAGREPPCRDFQCGWCGSHIVRGWTPRHISAEPILKRLSIGPGNYDWPVCNCAGLRSWGQKYMTPLGRPHHSSSPMGSHNPTLTPINAPLDSSVITEVDPENRAEGYRSVVEDQLDSL
jgi:hypothetical protein